MSAAGPFLVVLLLAGAATTGCQGERPGKGTAAATAPSLTGTSVKASPSPVPAKSTGLPSDGTQEGPRIDWDARLNHSVTLTLAKLARWPGLAFVPVVPVFPVRPSRIYLSTDPAFGGAGGMIELHYTFATSSAFPDDGRVVVREQPVATAVGGLDMLARGVVPPKGGQRIVAGGHVSWLTDTDGSFAVFTVRGKALVVIAGPAVSRAAVLTLAAKL